MRCYILLSAVFSVVAAPAIAQDRGVYAGIEGGVSFPRSTDYDVSAMRVQTVPTGNGLLGQTVTTTNMRYGNGFNADYKTALDTDAIAGYGFGFLRLEGELGYKRTRVKRSNGEQLSSQRHQHRADQRRDVEQLCIPQPYERAVRHGQRSRRL